MATISVSHRGLRVFLISNLLFLFGRSLLDGVAGRGHESLLQGRDAAVSRVAALELLGLFERQNFAVHHDADAVAELLGLAHVVGTEEDRGVVLLADAPDERLHVPLAPRVEPRSRLVEEHQDRARQERTSEGHLLLHTAGEMLHRLEGPLGGEADVLQDLLNPGARLAGGYTVELRPVEQVLHRRELLEEASLDADPVHAPLHPLGMANGIHPKDLDRARVREDERRDHTHQRALPAPVGPEDAHHLTPLHRERDRVEGAHHLAPAFLETLLYVLHLQSVHSGPLPTLTTGPSPPASPRPRARSPRARRLPPARRAGAPPGRVGRVCALPPGSACGARPSVRRGPARAECGPPSHKTYLRTSLDLSFIFRRDGSRVRRRSKGWGALSRRKRLGPRS